VPSDVEHRPGARPVMDGPGRCAYLPRMMEWIGRLVAIRTTSDGAGPACRVITGLGATPDQALAKLRNETESWLAQEAQMVQEANDEEDANRNVAYEEWRKNHKETPEELRTGIRIPPHLAPRGPRRPPEERRFEVVDLRLVPARLEGEASGWLAYGTLAQEGGSK